jgi:hypothetical protein
MVMTALSTWWNWIPACAGMTHQTVMALKNVIPAQAGIQAML